MKQLALVISVVSILLASAYYFNKHSLYENYVLENKSDDVYSYKINLNLANKREFMNLPGIGETTAQNIIDYRDNVDRFNKIEDIMKVKGIGTKTYAQIKEYLTMEVF